MGFGFDRDLTVAGVSSLEIKNSKYGIVDDFCVNPIVITLPCQGCTTERHCGLNRRGSCRQLLIFVS